MDFDSLLQPKSCSCGMVHSCAIRHVAIKKNALDGLEAVAGAYRHILLAADTNTYPICGEQVVQILGSRVQGTLVFQRQGLLIPNEEAIAQLDAMCTPETDLILGIGSGVIQDLCKYVSFQRKLPYQIIATAPSMDGYASVGAAMITGGMKVTYATHVPEAIVADVDVLKDAPMELIQSGYGDILGKYSCLNDWKLAALVRGEYFCQYVYDLTYDMLCKTKDLGPALQARDPEAIRTLMEALVGVGIAMAFVGNSRPASGSEHHLSHFFEIVGIVRQEPYFMHGTDVAYSAVYTQKLRQQLLQYTAAPRNEIPSRDHWEANIRRVYGSAAEGVIALQEKTGWYRQDRQQTYRENWDAICDILKEVPSDETLSRLVASVGLDIRQFEDLYGAEKIRDALCYGKDLKDRYSVLWMYYDLLVTE